LFDICYLPEQQQWINWLKTVPEYVVPTDCSYASIVVPTLDSIRINNNLNRLLKAGKHTLIVGPTGTGKSISV
jgi:MoxR-like ATPase